MRKHLIIVLAIAGLAATTACGSKSSYKSIKADLHDKPVVEVLPPLADANAEQQAVAILNNDAVFKDTHGTESAAILKETIDAVEMKVGRIAGADTQVQAEVALLTQETRETCAPTSKQSAEFASTSMTKGFAIPNLGRGICIDQECKNAILILEKQEFVMTRPEVTGSVAILMKRDEASGTLKPVVPQTSDLFVKDGISASIEDGIAACEKDKETPELTDKEKADRIIAINVEITKLNKQIAEIQASTEMGVNEKAEFIKGLQAKIAQLEEEKKSLGGETTDKPDNVGTDDSTLR